MLASGIESLVALQELLISCLQTMLAGKFVCQNHVCEPTLVVSMPTQHLGDEPQRAAQSNRSVDAVAAAALQPRPPGVSAGQIRHPASGRRCVRSRAKAMVGAVGTPDVRVRDGVPLLVQAVDDQGPVAGITCNMPTLQGCQEAVISVTLVGWKGVYNTDQIALAQDDRTETFARTHAVGLYSSCRCCLVSALQTVLDGWQLCAGLLDASPKVQASAVTVLCQALAVPRLGDETRAALLVSSLVRTSA